jgi:hypothetical protein
MAFTIGKYGIASVIDLAMLVATFELTSFLFIVVILDAVCFYNDFSVFALICYIKEKAALGARRILVGGCATLADGKDRKSRREALSGWSCHPPPIILSTWTAPAPI